ncbi:hypothetical protein AJ87_08250 [Rhizobium yanglingense]|nr:hypothetical protein AJ87_08250 [Rhizobium yanglingense]
MGNRKPHRRLTLDVATITFDAIAQVSILLVRTHWRDENRISITPFPPLPEPQGLQSVKTEIGRRWPMTELLDVLKQSERPVSRFWLGAELAQVTTQ